VLRYLFFTVLLTVSSALLCPVYSAGADYLPEKGYYLAGATPEVQNDSRNDDETQRVIIYEANCADQWMEGTTGVVKGKEELSGTWIGYEPGSDGQWSGSFTISGRFEIKGPNQWYKGKFACDSTHSPKYLTLYMKESSDPTYVGKICLSIYKIDTDTLTISSSEPGSKMQPNSLFTQTGGARVLVVTKQR
jgi:uncharacterized protein (TIGR03067 family)